MKFPGGAGWSEGIPMSRMLEGQRELLVTYPTAGVLIMKNKDNEK